MEKPNKPIENAAVKRWLLKNPVKTENNQITLLGDDLYSRQPICELALKQGYNFIFVTKPSSHKTLYEWLDFLEKNGEMIIGEIKKYEKGKEEFIDWRSLKRENLSRRAINQLGQKGNLCILHLDVRKENNKQMKANPTLSTKAVYLLVDN